MLPWKRGVGYILSKENWAVIKKGNKAEESKTHESDHLITVHAPTTLLVASKLMLLTRANKEKNQTCA